MRKLKKVKEDLEVGHQTLSREIQLPRQPVAQTIREIEFDVKIELRRKQRKHHEEMEEYWQKVLTASHEFLNLGIELHIKMFYII